MPDAMSETILKNLDFFGPQIVQAMVSSVLLASTGIFVVLRRMVFSGFAVSQAAGMSLALLLALDGPQWMTLPLSFVCMFPFMRSRQNSEVLSGCAFVLFFALTEVIVALGARAEMHAVQALHGNVLTMKVLPLWVVCGGAALFLAAIAYLQKPFTRVFFDADQARLHGDRTSLINGLFLGAMFAAAGVGTMQLGAYYSMAQMLLPAAIVLPFCRSILSALISACAVAAVCTAAGFIASFVPLVQKSGELHLPTSSTIILLMGVVFAAARGLAALRQAA